MHIHSQRTPVRPAHTTHHPSRTPHTRRGLHRALAALLLAGGVLLGVVPAASAHDTLTDSSPAEGQTLTEPPTEVRLTFSADVLELGAAVEVTDGDGATWPTGEPVVEGPEVTVPLEELPGGDYEIAWRVTSSDGHPISGLIPFTVEAQPAPSPTAEPTTPEETTAPDQESASPTPEETQPAPTTDAAAPVDDGSEEESSGGLPWLPIVIGLVAALLVYAVVRVTRRGATGDGEADHGAH